MVRKTQPSAARRVIKAMKGRGIPATHYPAPPMARCDPVGIGLITRQGNAGRPASGWWFEAVNPRTLEAILGDRCLAGGPSASALPSMRSRIVARSNSAKTPNI
jgi:hypothetical protein